VFTADNERAFDELGNDGHALCAFEHLVRNALVRRGGSQILHHLSRLLQFTWIVFIFRPSERPQAKQQQASDKQLHCLNPPFSVFGLYVILSFDSRISRPVFLQTTVPAENPELS
jgi:hypothetical protein